MTRLYELTGKWAEVQQRAENGDDVGDLLAVIGDALEQKAEGTFAVLRGLDADIDALCAEEKRIAARRKSIENNRERLRDYIRDCMDHAGVCSLKTPTATLTVSDGPPSVNVTDDGIVPAEYVQTITTIKVNKTKIKAAFEQFGECVPGTEITRKRVLTVR